MPRMTETEVRNVLRRIDAECGSAVAVDTALWGYSDFLVAYAIRAVEAAALLHPAAWHADALSRLRIELGALGDDLADARLASEWQDHLDQIDRALSGDKYPSR